MHGFLIYRFLELFRVLPLYSFIKSICLAENTIANSCSTFLNTI